MATYPSRGTSYWMETAPTTDYPKLTSGLDVDVAIVGGGIAGLTTAYLLKKRGKKVAVIEKSTLGDCISGFTTGKITSQHSTTYTSLVRDFGEEHARLYGEANEEAIVQIETIIKNEKIDCNWRREDNYVYTEKPEEIKKLQQEADDAARLGLPATYESTTPLPYEVQGAVKFANQATFHIGKYLQGLARAVHGNGSFVFEHTKASFFSGGEHPSFITPGGKVTAKDVIIATNVPTPIIMHTYYGLMEYPSRSYIVAGKTDKPISGMYINTGSPGRSVLPVKVKGQDYLLIGGEGHMVGLSGPASNHYEKLSDFARDQFSVETDYEWTSWDYVAYDSLPLVGKAYPFSKHMYVATGFRKWGLSNSMVAAMILSDELSGTKSPWADTFRSNRLSSVTSMPKGILKGVLSSFS
jgi:glycine/D-amino acid oxidase-like deaminating enzyme